MSRDLAEAPEFGYSGSLASVNAQLSSLPPRARSPLSPAVILIASRFCCPRRQQVRCRPSYPGLPNPSHPRAASAFVRPRPCTCATCLGDIRSPPSADSGPQRGPISTEHVRYWPPATPRGSHGGVNGALRSPGSTPAAGRIVAARPCLDLKLRGVLRDPLLALISAARSSSALRRWVPGRRPQLVLLRELEAAGRVRRTERDARRCGVVPANTCSSPPVS